MIVLFLLLLVGTAQAVDQVWDSVTPGCKMFQHDGRVELVCDGDDPIPLKESICYQKMREAMRWIDPMTKSYNENKQQDPHFDVEKQYREYDKGHAQWDATMKECVR